MHRRRVRPDLPELQKPLRWGLPMRFYNRSLDAGHPDVAKVLDSYAALLRETGRADEALELETRAQAIRAK